MKLTKALGMISVPAVGSIREDENARTIAPPPMSGQSPQPNQQQQQQKVLQRKQLMQQHMPQIQQATKIQGDLEQAAKALRGSLQSLKTKQAVSDVQHLMGLLQQIQQLVTSLPVLENKQINEDHGDQLEKSVESVLEQVGDLSFKAVMAIKAGRYDEALKMMSHSVQSLNQAMDVLEQRAKQGSLHR